jgi:hypothetical protein
MGTKVVQEVRLMGIDIREHLEQLNQELALGTTKVLHVVPFAPSAYRNERQVFLVLEKKVEADESTKAGGGGS